VNVLIGVIIMPPVNPAEGLVASYHVDPETGNSRPKLEQTQRQPTENSVRIALVQQNTDPRKNDYDVTLDTLIRLTNIGERYNPDLVVWSETAFVPNIRRWSQVDPADSVLARTVHRFLDYQNQLGNYLITGNDDYDVIRNESGQEIDRTNYNATVFFSDEGERLQTYRKMVLVPLTETFPYEEFFPGWFYKLFPSVLQAFVGLQEIIESLDVNLWGEGTEYVQFEHPEFRFFTPICFEDAFAYHVRDFILSGSDMIINLSNDYWSLDEVEAQQHLATGLFRTVENRVPMARATASGVTGYIDAYGRLLAHIPNYVEGVVVVDTLPGRQGGMTLYTRWGDWFPVLLVWLILLQVGVYSGIYGYNRFIRKEGRP
jgi:apolipoprotein N-acyltransferase